MSERKRTTRWTTGPPLVVGLVVLWLLLWRSVAPLTIVTGADVHLEPDVVEALQDGSHIVVDGDRTL